MAYTITSPLICGLPAITNIDSGYTPVNGTSAIPSSPMVPGMIVHAVDPTYGEGEFILLKGVASTAVGSLVRYNAVTFQTVLATNTAVQDMPVAVAMSANLAGTWGWYQITGTAALSKTIDAIIAANVAVYLSPTAGTVRSIASAGKQIVACRTQLASTGSTTATVLVTINRPHLQSQVT